MAMTLARIALLGTVEAWAADGRRVDLGTPRQQAVFAVLSLRANTPVAADSLLEAVWGSDYPASGVQLVQAYIHRLRRAIDFDAREGRAHGTIRTVNHSYVLSLPPAAMDLVSFEQQTARAAQARTSGQPKLARDLLADALRMWRGEPLAGLSGPLLDHERERLLERYRAAQHDLLELELQLGHHREVVAELSGMVTEDPLQERLVELLMLALYRSGRRRDALALYGRTRRLLDDELGVRPGPGLRQLHMQILRADAVAGSVLLPAGPRSEPAPAQLPRDIDEFIGREVETASLVGVLSATAGTPVAVVYGRPGIGKTTLAVHVAHRARGVFSSGQLYVDLRGTSAGPVEPDAALEYLLRSLGIAPADLPKSLAERAALFRTWLAGRRMLVLLDDAASAEQVRPLLPAGPGPAALITSRHPLADLDGIRQVHLDSFDRGDGLRMLRAVVGEHRVDTEPAAARDIITACAGLPLAIRIVAGKLATSPQWPLQHVAAVLSEEGRRLDALSSTDRAVRTSIAQTADTLAPSQRHAFMLLSLVDITELDIASVAALLDTDERTATDIIDGLVASQLVDAAPHGPARQLRLRFDALVRLYAREQAGQHLDRAAIRAAIVRLLDLDRPRMERARCLSPGGS